MAHNEHTRHTRARLYTGLGAGALLTGALAYTGLVDPHRTDTLFPVCPFKLLTGWNCPACGGLRVVHDLLHGDLAAAAVDNVFLLVVVPAIALWILMRARQGKPAVTPTAIAAVTAMTMAWTVIRNVPGFPLVPTILGG